LSKYLHALSLAALIAMVGMPFSDLDIEMLEIKLLMLLLVTATLLVVGILLLEDRNGV